VKILGASGSYYKVEVNGRRGYALKSGVSVLTLMVAFPANVAGSGGFIGAVIKKP
jgi:hypothetical protein